MDDAPLGQIGDEKEIERISPMPDAGSAEDDAEAIGGRKGRLLELTENDDAWLAQQGILSDEIRSRKYLAVLSTIDGWEGRVRLRKGEEG